MGLAWIIAPLLPASHIIPLGTVLAERLLYVPSLGYSILIGLGVERYLSKMGKKQLQSYVTAAIPAAVILLAIFTSSILQRNRDWRSNESLWEADYASHPQNIKMATTHAKAISLDGDYELAWNITGKAYEVLPTDIPNLIVYAKATALSNAGGRDFAKAHAMLDEGIKMLEERNHYKSRDYDIFSTKAFLFTAENRPEEAKPLMLKALEVASHTDVDEPKPYCNLGEIEARLGLWADGIEFMEKCIAMSSKEAIEENKQHMDRLDNLGKAYYMTKQWDKAEEIFLESKKLRENPDIQRLLDFVIEQKKKIKEAAAEEDSTP